MKKTLYIRKDDIPTWVRAQEIIKDDLAPLISNLLKKWVDEHDSEIHRMASGIGEGL